ncbi:MAG: hypothetical protein ACE5GE_10845 [Phycisphaerae bacterium]
MIEFKAECGHTIRAKDEDEGKVVRCSYCGKTTQVPSKDEDEIDSLFSDMAEGDAGGTVSAGQRIKPRRHRRSRTSSIAKSSSDFNPFAVVMKMVYVAVILIVLIFCGRMGYDYVTSLNKAPPGRRVADARDNDRNENRGTTRNSTKKASAKLGLLDVRMDHKRGGIYFNSVPIRAEVRFRRLDHRSTEEEIFLDPKAQRAKTDAAVALDAGAYEVAVGLPLNNGKLMKYPGYPAQRRLIEAGGSRNLLEEFFIPDMANAVSVIDLPTMETLIVRRYQCSVINQEWISLTALFLPNTDIEKVIKFLPRRSAYGFNEEEIRSELTFYEVDNADQTFIVDMLRRVGMAVYRIGDSTQYRSFMIHPRSGSISSKILELD